MKNLKIGVREVPGGGAGAPSIGCAGRFLGTIFRSGNETSGNVARGALLAGTATAGVRLRSQRFVPLIYRGHVYELHRSLYGGISACPTRIS